MDHKEAKELLWDFYDREMPSALREDMQVHCSSCVECRRSLETWSKFTSRLFDADRLYPAPVQTEAFVRRVMSQLESASASPWVHLRNLWTQRWILPTLGVGLAAAISFVMFASSPLQDPVEALMQQDEAGARFHSWVSGNSGTTNDVFSVLAGEQ